MMLSRRSFVRLAAAGGVAASQFNVATSARARDVRRIRSRVGVPAWLIEERSAPLVAIRFGVGSGSVQDPVGMEGLTAVTLAMLQEGAGDLDDRRFKDALRATSAQLTFASARDRVTGGIVSLSHKLDRAVDLMQLALTAPRFDGPSLDRVRMQLTAQFELAAADSRQAARDAWFANAFAGHAYGRPTNGTTASRAAIDRAALVAHHRRLFARDRLSVVFVGDIDEAGAQQILERAFDPLHAGSDLAPTAQAVPKSLAMPVVTSRQQPLSSAVLGLPGLSSHHADYATLLVLNHIMGSGEFDARWVEEVRVKRGLTYAIRSNIVSDRAISVLLCQFSTPNEAMGQAIAVVIEEMRRMVAKGPTDTEVENAKSYLTGALALGIDGNEALADTLLGFWLDGHSPEELVRRRDALSAVTRDGVFRLSAQILDPSRLSITIVGQPRLAP